MHKPESVLQNETYKILWDFEIETDHRISVRRPDLQKNELATWLVLLFHRITRTWLRKDNFKKEIESLLIAA